MSGKISNEIQNAFVQRTTEALRIFPETAGRRVALCAYISDGLDKAGIPHSVALGSLSCNGLKTFQYRKAFPSNPKGPIIWEGHTWIELDGYIGEPSLLRTARAQSVGSNLRRHLEHLGIIDRGAILMDEQSRREFGLKYFRKETLKKTMIEPLIAGLISENP